MTAQPHGDQLWAEYLRATRRLSDLRRAAAAAAAQQESTARAAGQALAEVRSRLALQRTRLRELASRAGSADPALVPSAAEIASATGELGPDPGAVLDALHRARRTVDEADAAILRPPTPPGPASWPPRLRNLLVYGPLAVVILAGQLILFARVSETALPLYAPLCGLVMPAIAFGLGFVGVGLAFPAPPGGRVDRTPVLGAAVCLATVAVLCAGLGVLSIQN